MEREFIPGVEAMPADYVDDVRPHGRFPSRQADLVEAQVGKHARKQQDLIILATFRHLAGRSYLPGMQYTQRRCSDLSG